MDYSILRRGALTWPSLFACATLTVACEGGGGRSVYVEQLGSDTLTIEEFARHPDRIEGRIIVRSPVTRVIEYTADLSPAGDIVRLESGMSIPETNPNQLPARHAVTTLQDDSAVTVVETEGEEGETTSVAAPEGTVLAVSKLPISVAFLEHAIDRALQSQSDSMPFPVLLQGSQAVASNAVVRVDDSTFAVDFFGSPMYVQVSEDGRVLAVSGRETTMKVETERVSAGSVDLDAMAAEFASRDARGEGFGVASPPATVQATVAGASLEVRYSQPAKRGREIFGGLVPWGSVWRTGANAATHFSTDRNLTIGDARVPAGTYTLWSIFTPESATLIINRQTGQWGTQYDESQDLVRIPMNREALDETAERFTIAIEEVGNGGVLKLMWDNSSFSVPIRVRR